MSKSDGGPAFPQPGIEHDDGEPVARSFDRPGMSLRDWFAGQAQTHLQVRFIIRVYEKPKKKGEGYIREIEWPPLEWSEDKLQQMVEFESRYAYAAADAMLRERARE